MYNIKMYIEWPFSLAFELLKFRSYWRRFVLPHRNIFSSFQQVRQLAIVSSTDFAEKKKESFNFYVEFILHEDTA